MRTRLDPPQPKVVVLSLVTLTFSGLLGSCDNTIQPTSPESPVSVDAAGLIVVTEPDDAASGTPLGVQPVIHVLDSQGNLLTSDNITVVTATLASGESTLEGTTSATAADGVVRFTDLTLTGIVGDHTLEFGASRLSPTRSRPFRLRPGRASTLRSVVTVSSDVVAVGETAMLALQAIDAQGNERTTGGRTVAFTSSPSAGTSAGTIGATVDNGNGSA